MANHRGITDRLPQQGMTMLPHLASLLLSVILLIIPGHAGAEEKISFGRFGEVTIYRQRPAPAQVVLFVSGDGGWNLGVVDMAQSLASLDALVVGIDITYYLREIARPQDQCTYSAADFEDLSHYIQKKLELPRYLPPVLVGYSSGATLVYAVLVQAPAGTFKGAISMGFCPDLPLSRPLCRGTGLAWQPGPKGKGYSFLPAAHLEAEWIVLQGDIDQVCDQAATEKFVKQTDKGQMILLPKVGHGFSVPKNWMPQFKEAFAELNRDKKPPAPIPESVSDLPIREVPADGRSGATLAVMYSGDGGWAGLDRELAGALAEAGIPVVGLDSLQYFWTPRTPEGAAADLRRILDHYLAGWQADSAILIGYSLGAEVLPFLVNRLQPELRRRLKLIALLGPGESASFEFHLSDWLGYDAGRAALPVAPEIERFKDVHILCFYGKEEDNALCPKLAPGSADILPLPGYHHFNGDYGAIVDHLLKGLRH